MCSADQRQSEPPLRRSSAKPISPAKAKAEEAAGQMPDWTPTAPKSPAPLERRATGLLGKPTDHEPFDLIGSLSRLNMLCEQWRPELSTQHPQVRRFLVRQRWHQLLAAVVLARFVVLFTLDDKRTLMYFGDYSVSFGWSRKLYMLVTSVIATTQLLMQQTFIYSASRRWTQRWLRLLHRLHQVSFEPDASCSTAERYRRGLRACGVVFQVLRLFAHLANYLTYPLVTLLTLLQHYNDSVEHRLWFLLGALPSLYCAAYISSFCVRCTNYVPFVFRLLADHQLLLLRTVNRQARRSMRRLLEPPCRWTVVPGGPAGRCAETSKLTAHLSIFQQRLLEIQRINDFWQYPLGIVHFYTLFSTSLILLMASFLGSLYMRWLVIFYTPIQLYCCALISINCCADILHEVRPVFTRHSIIVDLPVFTFRP